MEDHTDDIDLIKKISEIAKKAGIRENHLMYRKKILGGSNGNGSKEEDEG
jgi:hypothetical protein